MNHRRRSRPKTTGRSTDRGSRRKADIRPGAASSRCSLWSTCTAHSSCHSAAGASQRTLVTSPEPAIRSRSAAKHIADKPSPPAEIAPSPWSGAAARRRSGQTVAIPRRLRAPVRQEDRWCACREPQPFTLRRYSYSPECAGSFYRAPQPGRLCHKLHPYGYLVSAPRGPDVSRDGDQRSLRAEDDLRKRSGAGVKPTHPAAPSPL
jgi:hypothetical protein